MNKRIGLVIVSGILLAGALGACSAGPAGSSSTGSTDQAPAAAPPGGAATGFGGGKAGAPETKVTLAPGDVQRSIIYTGTMTVRVKDVSASAQAAVDIATGSGGYNGGGNLQIDAGLSTATVILRVPATAFDTTIQALHNLGTELNRQVSTQDVTSQVVDVQSRMKTQQASVDRIRALIANTKSIGEIVSLEDELTNREADLESMEAQLRTLTDLSSLSTITVTLLGPEAHVVVPPAPKKTGFIAGLKSGWHGFVASLSVLLTVVGAVLPFAIAIGVPAWIILAFVRRRRRRPATPVVIPTEQP